MATLTKSTGTVTLSGTAEKVTLPAAYGWVWLKNMSDADMFAGLSADISEGADGVMVIPSGECGRIQTDGFNSIYLMGTGNALVVAQNYADCPFKVGGKGGEIPDLSAYAKTADIQNENLLINPDFKINQRGKTDFSVSYHTGSPIPQSQVYTVDRWRIMDGEANISNGKYVLNGTIIQVLENSIGGDFTASVSVESGTATASYNDSTKTFTIVGDAAVLNWAKLEYSSNATQFFPPDPTTELLKCQRYFYKCTCNNIQGSIPSTCFNGCVRATVHLPTCMRTTPSLKIISAGYVYNDSGYISLENSGLFVYGMVGNYLAIKSANIVSISKDCAAATSDCEFEFDAEIY